MNDKKILIAGDIMLDIYHFGKVSRISPEAPVPVFLEKEKVKNVPGGAANVAVNIAAIGVGTILFSVTGEDDEGNLLIDLLKQEKVQVSNVKRIQNRRTTSKLRYIGPNNQQMLRVDTEDTEDIRTDLLEDAFQEIQGMIEEIGLIVLSDYRKGFLTEETAQKLIAMGAENHIPVLVDVKDRNINKYSNAFLLKPNRKELGEMTGMVTDTLEDVEKAAIRLCNNANCEYVFTTLGAEGMLLTDKNKRLAFSKSMAKEVFDVTGAGDTSIAYLAVELLTGNDIYHAIEVANFAAGVQVSKTGTSKVYREEVDKARNGFRSSGNKELDYYKENGLKAVADCKAGGKRIVFTNGCFDILHAGHIAYLKKAKELGDVLIVGLNSDDSVKRLKGKSRPINSLEDRCLLLSAMECIDYVVPFEEDTPYELIKALMPDVLVKGGDYSIDSIAGGDIVQANGGLVMTISLVEGKSTTQIVDKIREKSQWE